jgi:hypothetical protein
VVGYTATMLGITASSFWGMLSFREQNIVNSITLVKDGEHKGMLKINVSTSLITSRDVIADVNNTMAIYSLSNDDLGENDIENNVIDVKNYHDCSLNKTIEGGQFILRAEAWKDLNMLDWVLSIKGTGSLGDST